MHRQDVRKILLATFHFHRTLAVLLRGMSLAAVVFRIQEVHTMAGKNTAAFGIYPNQVALEEGLTALRDANFRREDISVLFPENIGTKDFGHEKATKAPEGASAGAGTRAGIGGGLGWVVGIGSIAIPGVRA